MSMNDRESAKSVLVMGKDFVSTFDLPHQLCGFYAPSKSQRVSKTFSYIKCESRDVNVALM
jgi:hypothetical protein